MTADQRHGTPMTHSHPTEATAERDASPGAPQPSGPACVCWPASGHGDAGWVREKRPAETGTVRALRRRMRAWVAALGLGDELAESVVLVVDEAVTNAVEHACPDSPCHVEVVAGPRACHGGVAVLVADDGQWQPAGDPGHRGRGIPLISHLCDRSTIDISEHGTTVRMCWQVPGTP